MSSDITLSNRELQRAAVWVSGHISGFHPEPLATDDAFITIRHIDGGGVGLRTIVMCERCDAVPGKAGAQENYLDVTDYNVW